MCLVFPLEGPNLKIPDFEVSKVKRGCLTFLELSVQLVGHAPGVDGRDVGADLPLRPGDVLASNDLHADAVPCRRSSGKKE